MARTSAAPLTVTAYQSARAAPDASLELVDLLGPAPSSGRTSVARRDLDDVGAPQQPVAPGAGRRVELGDPVGDVLPGAQGRERESA